MSGSAGDVPWMRGLKGGRGWGSPSIRAGAISWDSALGAEDTHCPHPILPIPIPPSGLP